MKKSTNRNGAFYFWMGFLIPAVICLIGYCVIRVWPFGDGTVLIIDSLHQYLPFYTDLHEKLVHHESLLYSFSAGLGYDFWATYAYYMASPMNFILVLVPTANVADVMDFLILIKIALSGGCFSWYLYKRSSEKKQSKDLLPIAFGAMFALSSFMIGYYFNLMWLDSVIMLPLIMYGIEQIIRKKSGKVYGLALFYGLWCNYYIGFMLCIFSCLYYVVQVVCMRRIRAGRLFGSAGQFAWYSLLAGGMSSIILIPAYTALSTSESMLNNSFPSTVKFYTDFVHMMLAHFAGQAPINISDSQVGLNAYCGTIVLILVVLYALDGRIRLRERIAHLGLAGLLLLSFSLNMLNYIWHGFHVQNGLPNRFAFIYIGIVLVMAYDALRDLKFAGNRRLAAAILIPVVFAAAAWVLHLGELGWYVYFITLILLLVYAVLLILWKAGAKKRRLIGIILACVLLAETSAQAIFGYICNDNVTRSIYLDDQKSYQELIGKQNDQTFFRSEIDSQRMRNVTMFAGGHAMVMFNSTMPASTTELCDRLGIEARTNKNGYNGVTKLINDLFGIKYVLSSKGKADTLYQFEKVDGDDNLTLYKNPNALSIGFLVDSALKEWDIEAGDPCEVQNQFVELATGMDPIYVLDRYIDMEDGGTYGIRIPDQKQVYLYLPKRVDSLSLTTPEYDKTYQTYTDHLYVINGTPENSEAEFKVEMDEGDQEQATVYTCVNAAYQAVVDRLAENQLTEVTAKGNRLSGTIQADRNGILLLTIPYSDNWTIRIDGEKVQPECIGDSMIGIDLTEGAHEISMVYVPGGFGIGSVMSLICLALYLAGCYIENKRRKEREYKMDFEFSKKAESFQTGIFSILNEKKEELQKQGKKIYNLSVGTPDFKTPQRVMEAVSKAALDPDNYKYSLKELPELVEAMQQFYQRRFDVELEKDEIMAIYGSQEGMAHIAWTMCDPGDLVLVPNPGYPIFKIGPMLCDAETWEYPLYEKNGFLPKLDEIPEDIAREAKMMVVSYPANPLCRLAPDEFYDELIAFAKKYKIMILHDNAYSDIVYDGRKGNSFLSHEGAKDVGVEFYSLSKSYNYTGARMSFVVGNRQVIEKFRTIRSQIDYGIFLPIQYGAIAALNEPKEDVIRQCADYEERNRVLCGGLRSIGWDVPDSEGTMFVWAPLPKGYQNSEKFCVELMERSGVIVVPGSSFGDLGEGYVRLALVLPPDELKEAVESIRESGILD